MSTLDGIGTRFNGVSQPDEQGHVHATSWFTFLYLPLVPLWRAEIKREITLPLKTFNYQVIQKLPLDKSEILKTYLYGWILIPLLLLGPALFLIPEIHQQLGIASPPPRNLIKGDSLNWHDWFFIAYIIYLVVLSVKLYSSDIKRGLPKDYKRFLS
ncbi:hypothetical protein [Cytophaga aurantiaca]|uniref:hypothetical protein n=1 Tax=Cytophaga aurantiaca TaxID=29530 RepID=UPI00035E2EB6|nr:hypothetical protein [Cytophaga aurantiaca]